MKWGKEIRLFNLVILGAVLLPALSFAGEFEHVLQTPQGAEHFLVHSTTNANGELEVQIEHQETHALIPGHTSNIVLYGRDLDNDGKIDAWFYPDDSGIVQFLDLPSAEVDGWDAASQIILQKTQYRDRWLVGILAHQILSAMTFTESTGDRFQRSMIDEEIELRDLEIRVNRLQKINPHDPNLLQYDEMLSDGWADLSQRISVEGIRDRFLYAAADIATYVATAGLAKGLGKLGDWVIPKVLSTAPGQWALDVYTRFSSGISDSLARATDRVYTRAADLGLDADKLASLKQAIRWPVMDGVLQSVRETLAEKIPAVVRGLNERGKIAALLGRSAEALGNVAKGALKQWKYTASSQALQLGVEIYERRDTLYSPNPLVFAKRIVTDKELIEDVGYMTWDSTLATGISVADANVKRRMVVCGILSLVDSTGANLLLRKEPDNTRTAIDTGWEVVVGNAQTQIDLAALNSFEKMAERTGNPKLKLLGYAAALIDDGIGYWGYEKLTNQYEKSKAEGKGGLSWVPIFGER